MTEFITTERRGHLFLIGLNRAAKRNAFTLEMLHGLSAAYGELERDPELRCGVLFAHGEHFTGGLDLADVAPGFATGDWSRPAGGVDPLALGEPRLSKPMVTAVQGICFTVGIELMLATEVRITASNARFAMLEVKRGIYPVGGATMRFVREAGWSNAMRYLLTGDEFNAQEAYRMNLVQEVVAPGQELERALSIAERIAAAAPFGVRAVMRSARMSLDKGEPEAARRLLPDLKPIMQTQDAQEGLAAFLERRPPHFSGK